MAAERYLLACKEITDCLKRMFWLSGIFFYHTVYFNFYCDIASHCLVVWQGTFDMFFSDLYIDFSFIYENVDYGKPATLETWQN